MERMAHGRLVYAWFRDGDPCCNHPLVYIQAANRANRTASELSEVFRGDSRKLLPLSTLR